MQNKTNAMSVERSNNVDFHQALRHRITPQDIEKIKIRKIKEYTAELSNIINEEQIPMLSHINLKIGERIPLQDILENIANVGAYEALKLVAEGQPIALELRRQLQDKLSYELLKRNSQNVIPIVSQKFRLEVIKQMIKSLESYDFDARLDEKQKAIGDNIRAAAQLK